MKNNKRPAPAPDALVVDGKVNLGTFDRPPRNVNLRESDFLGLGAATPDWLRSLRFKQWHFYLLVSRLHVFAVAAVDMGLAKSSFFYAYDRENKKYCEYNRMGPGIDVSLPASLYEGKGRFHAKGHRIDIHNSLDSGRHEIRVELAAGKGAPAVSAEWTVHQSLDKNPPLIVSLPAGGRRSMYSHKMIAPLSGKARIGCKEIVFDPATDYAVLDEHQAYYPRHIYWKWAAFGFAGKDGPVGANFTDNMIKDQRSWNENAIWTPGGISLLGPAHFEFDIKDLMKPWRITDEDGRIELDFKPLGIKKDYLNALIMKNDYRQPFGLFNGRMVDDSGAAHEVKDGFGVTEYFDALL